MSSQRSGFSKSKKGIDSRCIIVENVISGSFNGVPADRILTADDAENSLTGGGISSTTNLTVVNLNATNGTFEQVRINDSGTGTGNIANTDANEFVISSNAVGGMTIFSDDASFGAMYFGDTADNDIGRIIYDHLTNQLNLYANNTNILSITGSDVNITGGLDVTGTITGTFALTYPLLASPTGTPAAPAYSFSGDSNTGMYRPSDNTVALSTNGTMAIQASTALGTVDIDSLDLKMNNGKAVLLEATASGGYIEGSVYDATNYFAIYGTAYGGTKVTPTAVTNGRLQMELTGYGYDGSSAVQGAYIDFLTNGNWSGTAHGSELDFYATGTGAGQTPFNIVQMKGSTSNAQMLVGTNTASEPPLSWQIDTQSGFNNDGSGVATIVRKSIFANTSYLSSDTQMTFKGTNVGAAGAPPAPSIGFSRPNLITALSYTGFSGTSDTVANSRISVHIDGANSDRAGYIVGYFSKNGIHMKTNGSRSNAALYSFTSDISTGMNYPSDFTIGFLIQSDTKLTINTTETKITGNLTVTGTISGSVSSFPLLATPTGTPAAPAYSFSADTNTGMYSPSDNTIAFSNNGTQELIMDSSNNIVVGSTRTTGLGKLHVSNGSLGVISVNVLADDFIVENTGNSGISVVAGDNSISSLYFGTASNTNRLSISYDDSSMESIISTTTMNFIQNVFTIGNFSPGSVSPGGGLSAPQMQYNYASTTPGDLVVSLQGYGGSTVQAAPRITYSRSGQTASIANTPSGYLLGSNDYYGVGDAQVSFLGTASAKIECYVDATTASNKVPGNLIFSTQSTATPGVLQIATVINSSQQFLTASGSVTSPGIAFTSDINTGIFRSSDNTMAFSINGSQALRINNLQTIELNTDNRGTATLVAGTVTVNTGSVLASSYIFVSRNTPGGTEGHLSAPVASIVANTSFVINSSSAADTSTVNWFLMN